MKYPSLEVRKARAVFTAKLQSILRRLDSCATAELSCVFVGRRITCSITVTEVWVVGSYARGAAHCGDLDIVVKTEGGYATAAAVNHQLLGKLADVRVYLGTPDDNESGVPFPDAVKLWGAGADWAARLAAIVENATATRFPRKTDRIPLRTEQLRIGVELAEEVVDDKENGLLNWSFVPLDALVPVDLTDDDVHELDRFDASSAKRRLLPYVKAYMATVPGHVPTSEAKFDGGFWSQGGTLVHLGAGLPNYDWLNRPGIARMAVMPDLNARGPNGIWVLERGPAHPLTKAFEAAGAWLIGTDRSPVINHHIGAYEHQFAVGIDVFESEDAALAFIADVYADDEEEFGPPPSPMYVSGASFLSALAGVELIDFVNAGVAVAFEREAGRIARGLDAHYPGTKQLPEWFQSFFKANSAIQPALA